MLIFVLGTLAIAFVVPSADRHLTRTLPTAYSDMFARAGICWAADTSWLPPSLSGYSPGIVARVGGPSSGLLIMARSRPRVIPCERSTLTRVDSVEPRAAVHFPGSSGEFRSWFGTDADCLDYVDWLRWPNGFGARCVGMSAAGRSRRQVPVPILRRPHIGRGGHDLRPSQGTDDGVVRGWLDVRLWKGRPVRVEPATVAEDRLYPTARSCCIDFAPYSCIPEGVG